MEMPSSRSSIRWRGRRSSISNAPPGRCSSAVSIESDEPPPSPTDEDDGETTAVDAPGGWFPSLQELLAFDPTDLRSTSRRNKRMLASVRNSESMRRDEGSPAVSHIPHCGVEVCFVPQRFHYTEGELEPYRNIGDPEMDDLLQHLSENDNGDGSCGCGAFDDVVAHAASEYRRNGAAAASSPALRFYRHYYEDLPDWVDFDQIQRGIDVFLAYLPAAGCGLFYRSLVGGFSIPKVVEVLIATRYLVPSHLSSSGNGPAGNAGSVARDRRRSEERLVDTGGFLACCFAPADGDPRGGAPAAASLRPGGRGWEAGLRVRVLHAKIRRSLLGSRKKGGGGRSVPRWETERNGIPINQEDMAATLLAFSVNVLVSIEIVSGRPLPETEQRDYLALWRYIGWILGVDTVETDDGKSSNSFQHNNLMPIDPCGPRKLNKPGNHRQFSTLESEPSGTDPDNDSIIHAYAALESIILHILHPEQKSCDLVIHLLSLRRFVTFRSEMCRKFLGTSLSDELQIPKSSVNWKGWRKESIQNFVSHLTVKFFLYFFLIFLRCYTALTMSYPWIRRRAIVWHAVLETKFMQTWEKMHAKRMIQAEASEKELDAKPKSHCPFSMIMAPNPAK